MPTCTFNVHILVSRCTFSHRRPFNRFLMMERMKGRRSVCACAHACLPCHLLSRGLHLGPSVQLTGNQQHALSKCSVLHLDERTTPSRHSHLGYDHDFRPPPPLPQTSHLHQRYQTERGCFGMPEPPIALKPKKDGGHLSLSHKP